MMRRMGRVRVSTQSHRFTIVGIVCPRQLFRRQLQEACRARGCYLARASLWGSPTVVCAVR